MKMFLKKQKAQAIDRSSLFLFRLHVQRDTTHSVTQSKVMSEHQDGAKTSEGIGWLYGKRERRERRIYRRVPCRWSQSSFPQLIKSKGNPDSPTLKRNAGTASQLTSADGGVPLGSGGYGAAIPEDQPNPEKETPACSLQTQVELA